MPLTPDLPAVQSEPIGRVATAGARGEFVLRGLECVGEEGASSPPRSEPVAALGMIGSPKVTRIFGARLGPEGILDRERDERWRWARARRVRRGRPADGAGVRARP